MNYKLILTIAFFVIFISIQFTLNLILKELRDLKRILIKEKESERLKNLDTYQNIKGLK